MNKYKVIVPTEYVEGYLKYGHGEVIVEADTEEEAIKKGIELAKNRNVDIYVDEYSLEDYSYDYEHTDVEEII